MEKSKKVCECSKKQIRFDFKTLNNKFWWKDKIKHIENELNIPDYKRLDTLQRCLKKKTLTNLLKDNLIEVIQRDTTHLIDSEKPIVKTVTIIPHPTTSKKQKVQQTIPYTNPYIEFMAKTPEEAQVWYPKPRVEASAVPLIFRDTYVIDWIAEKFAEEIKSITPKESQINKETIICLFSLLCPFPIAQNMSIISKVLASVPKQTAKTLNAPKLSTEARVIHQILRDIKAISTAPVTVAFLKCLPDKLKIKPFHGDLKEKWLEHKITYGALESFETVFKDILDLEITRKFCLHILAHHELSPPSYLKKVGMLIKANLQKPTVEFHHDDEDIDPAEDVKDLINIVNELGSGARIVKKSSGTSMKSDLSDIHIII